MKVRKHIFINETCCVCGADSFTKLQRMYSARNMAVPQTDERTCLERDDHYGKEEMRPEPKRRDYAFDDANIGKRMKELEAERIAAVNYIEPTAQTAAPEEVDWMCGMYGTLAQPEPVNWSAFDAGTMKDIVELFKKTNSELMKITDVYSDDLTDDTVVYLSEKSIG